LNKEDLIDAIANKADLKKSEARKAADAVFASLAAAFEYGDSVRLDGFGTFTITGVTDTIAAGAGREPGIIAQRDALPGGQWTTETAVGAEIRRLPAAPFPGDYQLLEEAAEEFRCAAERLLAAADEALAEARKGKEETRAILDRIEARLAQHGAE
jgi:nucleoid DNA-binding protein